MAGGVELRALAPTEILVRGGLAKLKDTEKAALLGERGLGSPCLSLYGGGGMSATQILRVAPDVGQRSWFRQTTAGRLYHLGFGLEKTRGPYHYTLWLPDRSEATLLAFIEVALDGPEVNPIPPPEPLARR